MWTFEHRAQAAGYNCIAGVDEAGRGPLAGPVVSAAVVLDDGFPDHGIMDSKKLSPKKRELLYDVIMDKALGVCVGIASHHEIDRINILRASLLSMRRAVNGLPLKPDYLLIDGTFFIDSSIQQQVIVKGDALSVSIAAASIVAKVTRDRIMVDMDQLYPGYGFARHKGYPTKAHKQALVELGPSPVHRYSFKGVCLP
ncbi:RnhB [Desulforapulum autotrophicum HRM2]|uniref:Ribonuclease HII n=1 Tax=Desulforapulum autotrophicum (strain ATCC 43914 / DSM 3382 / VKM B-1955 / HRM2) TaxID=177437 RepID=C0QKT8_DESAH|nr:ribonuclease HII [Desulforapulum autotrophicum]ACN16178.1 RnhB [Desulforapulum autotrophicum HRM2]